MNILYINHYAGSPEMGMEFRPYYLAREWQKMGHKVRIVAGSYSHLRKNNPIITKDFEIQNIEGVEFQWIKTSQYSSNGLGRAKTIFEFVSKLETYAQRFATEFQPNVVITSSTYPLDTYPAQKIARLAQCKYVHEAHDLWPLTLTEIGGMSKSNPFVRLLAVAETSAYRNADEIVSLFPNAYIHMLNHGMQSMEKFHHIPNGIVPGDWEEKEDMPEQHRLLFESLKSQGKYIVEYIGGHGLPNALDYLVEAARQTKEIEQIAYVLVGKGMEKDYLIEVSKQHDLKNIYFLPPVNKSQVPSVLAEADVLYIGAAKSNLYKFGISMNKLYDYMMAEKPIVFGIDAANNEVEIAKCGITIEPEKPEQIVMAVKELLGYTAENRAQMGARAKAYVVSNYDYSKLAKKFEEIIVGLNNDKENKHRILYIEHYAGSSKMGMEFRPYYLSKEWIDDGHEVRIVAGSYSHLRKFNPEIERDFEIHNIEGVEYQWVKTISYSNSSIKRARTIMEFCGKLLLRSNRIAKEYNPDVVISSSTYPLDAFPARRIANKANAKHIHEIHDMWPITPMELFGMSKYNPFVVAMQIGENFFCRKADKIVSILPSAKEYLVNHGMEENKFHVITNGINLEDWENTSELNTEIKEAIKYAKADGKFVIGFFGSHTRSYGLDTLLRAAKLYGDDKLFLIFVGGGNYKSELKQLALDLGISENSYRFFEPIDKAEIPALIMQCDASYVGAIRNKMFRFGIGMNKLFDAMMGAKPILYAVDAPNNYIEKYQCGISAEAENDEALAEGIKKLVNLDDKTRNKMGENGRNAVIQNFNFKVLAKKFLEIMDN